MIAEETNASCRESLKLKVCYSDSVSLSLKKDNKNKTKALYLLNFDQPIFFPISIIRQNLFGRWLTSNIGWIKFTVLHICFDLVLPDRSSPFPLLTHIFKSAEYCFRFGAKIRVGWCWHCNAYTPSHKTNIDRIFNIDRPRLCNMLATKW